MTTSRLTDEHLSLMERIGAQDYATVEIETATLRRLCAEVRASRAAATTGGAKTGTDLAAVEKLIHAFADAHRTAAGLPADASIREERAAIVTCDEAWCDLMAAVRALATPPPGSAAPGVVEIAEVQRVPMPWESTAREDGAAAPCDECGRVASDEERLRHAFRPGLCNNPGGWAPPLDREALTTCGACGSRAPAPGAAPATAAARDGEGA